MMKFMKRALSLLISAMLLLGCFALAEEAPLLPIAIVSYDLTDERRHPPRCPPSSSRKRTP